jgi:hypothetical protein
VLLATRNMVDELMRPHAHAEDKRPAA